MTIKERVAQALWGAGGEGPSPENAHPPATGATGGCFERPPLRTPLGPAADVPIRDQFRGKASPDNADASELHAALMAERRACQQKDQELAVMQQLLAKLESSIEQQATDAKLEQDRISLLERSLAERRPADQDEKVEKLLLAVAGEKRKAEEQAKQVLELQEELLTMRARCGGLEEQIQEKDTEIKILREEIAGQEVKATEAKTRFDEKGEQVLLLQRQLEQSGVLLTKMQSRLDARNRESDKRAARGVDGMRQLQQQLADELSQRMALQGKLAEKERQLAVLQVQRLSNEDIERQRSVQEQLIQKEREVCELQEQLADELQKRREVQYQNIERERLVHEKDRVLQQLQADLAAERSVALGAQLGIGSTRRSLGGMSTATEEALTVIRRCVTPTWAPADDEVIDGLPPGPPMEAEQLWGPPPAAPSGRSSVPPPGTPGCPGPERRIVPTHSGRVVVPPVCTPRQKPELQQIGGGGGGSLTFSSVPGLTVQSGQIRQRAYVAPGAPPWGATATPPTSVHQCVYSARRVAQASRTFG
mmetsp:Transcript_113888/g.328920  ORF Transcript_113888/g.328920 Transcript_113888/m.328920 type:complete len:536 (-) Transcript_113888:68-1675(-)